MEITTLTFRKDGKTYISTFTSVGECVIQLQKAAKAQVSVYANIEGMKPTLLYAIPNPLSDSIIFGLDIAKGIEVTIKSTDEIYDAKMLVQ